MRKVLTLVLLLLPGCAEQHGIRPLAPLELATIPYQQTASEARIGSLMYEGGCLIFSDGEKPTWLLPVWPDGSVFNGTLVTFHQPAKDDQRVAVGEQFVMGGHRASWQQLASARYAPFWQQCRVQPFIVSSVRPAD
jgi:hypothetical protein